MRIIELCFLIFVITQSAPLLPGQTVLPTEPVHGIVRNGLGMEFVPLPSGEFYMGSGEADIARSCALTNNAKECQESWIKKEMPKHQVKVGHGVLMMRYEVTQSQWRSVMGTTIQQQRDKQGKRPVLFGLFKKNYSLVGVGDDLPMYYVSWPEANGFVKKMNERNDGYLYSLPSESEWEYACRAGTTSLFSFGDTLSLRNANAVDSNFRFLETVTKVGAYPSNAWGIFDMEGNVSEWTADMYFDSYDGLPLDGSPNTSKRPEKWGENVRVLRGGDWGSSPFNSRCASRHYDSEKFGYSDTGFRLTARKK